MTKKDTNRASLVHKTADITGFSKRYVRQVINGARKSEIVMQVFMELMEGENALIKAVKELIPF